MPGNPTELIYSKQDEMERLQRKYMGPYKGEAVVVERSAGYLDVFELGGFNAGTGDSILTKEVGNDTLRKSVPLAERDAFKVLNNPWKTRREYADLVLATGAIQNPGFMEDFVETNPDEIVSATDVIAHTSRAANKLPSSPDKPRLPKLLRTLESHQGPS